MHHIKPYKSMIKLILAFTLIIAISGCVMAVRKSAGQIRPTNVDISPCPHSDAKNIAIIIKEKEKGTLSEKYQQEFYGSLQQSFAKSGVSVYQLTPEKAEADKTPVHLTINFDDLSHSFIKNSWELKGNIVLTDNGKTTTSNFSAITHKTLESKTSMLENLTDEMASCIIQSKENH
jgi:hypothetical protein